eukprot:479090-Prorocentrum_minimum.AAC.2
MKVFLHSQVYDNSSLLPSSTFALTTRATGANVRADGGVFQGCTRRARRLAGSLRYSNASNTLALERFSDLLGESPTTKCK